MYARASYSGNTRPCQGRAGGSIPPARSEYIKSWATHLHRPDRLAFQVVHDSAPFTASVCHDWQVVVRRSANQRIRERKRSRNTNELEDASAFAGMTKIHVNDLAPARPILSLFRRRLYELSKFPFDLGMSPQFRHFLRCHGRPSFRFELGHRVLEYAYEKE